MEIPVDQQFCSIEGCPRATFARGWCRWHYKRWYDTGEPGSTPAPPLQVCTVDGCDREQVAQGLCSKHYKRSRAHQKPPGHNSRRATHCKRGQEFTPENTYIDPQLGTRKCRTCQESRSQAYVEQRRQRRLAEHPLPPPRPITTFAGRVLHARTAAGWTQLQLAERAGLRASTISGIERGRHGQPWFTVVAALATALGVSARWLAHGDAHS